MGSFTEKQMFKGYFYKKFHTVLNKSADVNQQININRPGKYYYENIIMLDSLHTTTLK